MELHNTTSTTGCNTLSILQYTLNQYRMNWITIQYIKRSTGLILTILYNTTGCTLNYPKIPQITALNYNASRYTSSSIWIEKKYLKIEMDFLHSRKTLPYSMTTLNNKTKIIPNYF